MATLPKPWFFLRQDNSPDSGRTFNADTHEEAILLAFALVYAQRDRMGFWKLFDQQGFRVCGIECSGHPDNPQLNRINR